MTEERWQFEKIGLGYRCWSDDVATEFHFTHIKRAREALNGELSVRTRLSSVKTNGGVMHVARFNVLSSSSRAALAKLLEKRTPGLDMDWFDGLETLCQKVILAEQKGEDVVEVGHDQPMPKGENYMLEPLVLKGRTSMLFGPGGVGKSLIALTSGISVAADREIIPGLKPTVSGNVLYLDWETTAAVVNDRIRAIAAGHGFEPPKISYRRCVKPLADDTEELAAIVAQRNIALMIVDSAAYAMGASGEYGDANESVLRLHEALRVIGTTTLIIDHVNKTDAKVEPGKATPYGSAYKTWAARMSWEIRKAPSPEGVLRVNLYHAKSNDTATLAPIGLELDWQDYSISFSRSEVVSEDPESPDEPRITWGEKIMELLEDSTAIRASEVHRLIGCSSGVARMTIERLIEKGRIDKDINGYISYPKRASLTAVSGGLG